MFAFRAVARACSVLGSAVLLAAPAVADPILLSPPLAHPAGTLFPIDVAADDVDGDGHVDLVVLSASALMVLRGLGAGTFAAAEVASGAANTAGVRIAVGDLDGDGRRDLAIADWTGQRIVLHRSAGGGAFDPPVSLPVGAGTRSVALGDWNGDGDLEVAGVSYFDSKVRIFERVGPGLACAEIASLDVGYRPKAIEMADLDQDGRADLVAANGEASTATVWFARASGPVRLDLPTPPLPTGIAIADLDQDGRLDLAIVTHTGAAHVRFNLGGGSFSDPTALAMGTYPHSIAAADLDRDGKSDLVVSDWGGHRIGISENQGGGGFAPPTHVATLDYPTGIAIEDVNEDGVPDVVLANDSNPGRLAVHVNQTLGPKIASFVPSAGTAGTAVTIRGSRFTGATEVRFGALPAAFSVASDSVIHATAPLDVRAGPISVTTAEGAGVSVQAFIAPPVIVSFAPSRAPAGATVTVVGRNFAGATSVTVGAVPASFAIVLGASDEVRLIVPAGATAGPIRVENPAGHAETPAPLRIVTVSGFAPTAGVAGTPITIQGTALEGTTEVRFGPAAAVPTLATATEVVVAVPPGARSGPLDVVTDVGIVRPAGQFSAAPLILSFSPSRVLAGATVTVFGHNFAGSTGVSVGAIPVPDFTITLGAIDEVRLVVPPGATQGPIHVVNAAGRTETPSPLRIVEVTGFAPTVGVPGTPITIGGTELMGTTAVRFGPIAAAPLSASATEVVVAVPHGARSGPLDVVTDVGVLRSAEPFQAVPHILSFSPRRGYTGAVVNVRGYNYLDLTAATVGGVPAPFVVVSDTVARVTIAPEVPGGRIALTNAIGTTVTDIPFTLVPPGEEIPPGINLSWDECGIAGTERKTLECTITGPPYTLIGSFVPPPGIFEFTGLAANLVVRAGVGGLPSWWRHGPHQCRGTSALVASAVAGFAACLESHSAGSSAAWTSTIVPGTSGYARIQVATSVPAGEPIELAADNEYYGFRLDVMREFSGGGTCSGCQTGVTIELESVQLFQSPDYGDPVLTTPLERTIVSAGTPPTLFGFTPAAGGPGTVVTITGRNLFNATAVRFGGVQAAFQMVNDAEILATVPAGGRTGPIEVVNLAGSTGTAATFIVYELPEIASFEPTHAPVGYPVVLRGSRFSGTTDVRFGGVSTSFVVVSDSMLRTSVPDGAVSGPISVSNPYAESATTDPFVVDPGNPAGFNLAWDDCGAAGTTSKGFACDSNFGTPFTMVASFVPPGGIEHFTGLNATLTVQSAASALPDWWKHGPDGCRGTGGLAALFDFASGPSTCTDFFAGRAVGGHAVTLDPATPDRARVSVQGAVAQDDGGPLDANTEYYAFKLLLLRSNSAGASACAGCSEAATITLDRMTLFQPADVFFDPVLAHALQGATIQWQSKPGAALPAIHSFAPASGGPGTVVTVRGRALAAATQVRFGTRTAAFVALADSLLEAVAPPNVATSRIVVETPQGSAGAAELFLVDHDPAPPGINLAWRDCGVAGAGTQSPECVPGAAPTTLVASFVPPDGVTAFVGLSAQVDVRTTGGALPDWWKRGTAECRGTIGITLSADFTSGPFSCEDPWLGLASGGLDFQTTPLGPDAARLRVALAVPDGSARALDTRLEHYGFKLNLRSPDLDETCTGCDVPVCLVLDHIQLFQPAERGFDPMLVAPIERHYVSWGEPSGGCAGVATPVLASVASVDARADRVRIEWRAEGFTSAAIERRAEGRWSRLGVAVADGEHRLVWEDFDVRPGARYGYRLAVGDPAAYAGVAEVEVPATVALALERAVARAGGLVVSLALPTAAPATLEAYDVSGRRWASERITPAAPGALEVELRGTAPLRAGVWFVKLRQAESSVTRRFVIVR